MQVGATGELCPSCQQSKVHYHPVDCTDKPWNLKLSPSASTACLSTVLLSQLISLPLHLPFPPNNSAVFEAADLPRCRPSPDNCDLLGQFCASSPRGRTAPSPAPTSRPSRTSGSTAIPRSSSRASLASRERELELPSVCHAVAAQLANLLATAKLCVKYSRQGFTC